MHVKIEKRNRDGYKKWREKTEKVRKYERKKWEVTENGRKVKKRNRTKGKKM